MALRVTRADPGTSTVSIPVKAVNTGLALKKFDTFVNPRGWF
jgi:hypothetical protein